MEDVVDGPAPRPPAGRPSATELGLRVLTGVGLLVLFAALVYPRGLTLVAIALFGLAAGSTPSLSATASTRSRCSASWGQAAA